MNKEIGSVRAIYRYPIKSLEGQELPSTLLQPSAGIVGDRKWAFALGPNNNTNGEWQPCSNFDRLTINQSLASFKLNTLRENLRWQNDQGQVLELDQSCEKIIQRPDELPSLVPANQGYWDHKDATISIINLNTIKLLENRVDAKLDPARFRANFYVKMPPFEELYLLGQTLQIGEARLEFIRPTDRCKATSINPQTAQPDLNLPAALNRNFGHHFCGIYARVLNAGHVSDGDAITLEKKSSPSIPTTAIEQKTAPEIVDWPRPMTVTKIIQETPDIRSIWLKDHLLDKDQASPFAPGQHLKLFDLGTTHAFRAYTISNFDGEQFRLTVKKQKGDGSNALHKCAVGDQLLASGPHGEISIASGGESAVFLTAGIGITMATGLLPIIAKRQIKTDFLHIARNRQTAALWNEIEDFAKHQQQCTAHLFETIDGRPDIALILEFVVSHNAQLFLCGPPDFVNETESVALQLGFEQHNICAERFVTPDMQDAKLEPEHPGPFKVEFRKSGKSAIWGEAKGSLLDFAEEQGIAINNHCRAGICGKCKTAVISGSAQNAESAGSHVLCCSAFPSSDLVLDA